MRHKPFFSPTTHEELMRLGRRFGCHQMPQRSFFIRGKQCPLCARCTGVVAGYAAASVMFFLYAIPLWACVIGCAVMFADWYIQYMGLRESVNPRRLVTGIIGGYCLQTVYLSAIKITAEQIAALLAKSA